MADKKDENPNLKIKILSSNKIRYSYLQTNYFSSAGDLGKSCMRVKRMQKTLNFYIKNNVRIVVVVGDNNKIHARALLWENVKSVGRKSTFTYLDRVYAASEHLVLRFYELAKENKWKMYGFTSPHRAKSDYYIEGITIKGIYHFPWVDTFGYLYYNDNVIASSIIALSSIKDTSKYLKLRYDPFRENAGYFPELDPNRVREVITHKYVSKKDAIKVKRYKGYVSKINIANIDGNYYSRHDNLVIKSDLDGYILKENKTNEVLSHKTMDKTKAIHCPKYNGYVHRSNIVHIKGKLYHKQDTDIVFFENKWYHISQCFINYDRKGVNTELAIFPFTYVHSPDDYMPYWKRSRVWKKGGYGIPRQGCLIPKERAIIAYNLVYNPIANSIEHQEVYRVSREYLIQLVTGELVVNSSENKQYLKKFNSKWYIKQDFESPNKKQLLLFK